MKKYICNHDTLDVVDSKYGFMFFISRNLFLVLEHLQISKNTKFRKVNSDI